MRRSSMLGSFWQSRLAAVGLIAAAAALTAGCGKEQPPGSGAETPGKDPQAAQDPAKATPEGAAKGAENAPSQAAPATGEGDSKEAQGGSQAKVDPNKPAPARAPGAGAAAEAAAPSPPSAAGDAKAAEAASPAPAAAADDAKAAEVTSPKVGEANFSVWMQAAGKHKVGQQGTVEVVLIPKNGFHCNENYPYKIKLSDPPAGVTYPQAVVRKESMSVAAERGVMRVPFVPTAAGDQRIAGKFSFSVCSSDQCLIDSRDLAITVKVE